MKRDIGARAGGHVVVATSVDVQRGAQAGREAAGQIQQRFGYVVAVVPKGRAFSSTAFVTSSVLWVLKQVLKSRSDALDLSSNTPLLIYWSSAGRTGTQSKYAY